MKATLRALFGVSALALLLTAAPTLAADVDVTGDNVDTGAESKNINDFDVVDDLNQDVDNNSDVDNVADVDADTGDNDQNKNTNSGDQESGAVDATADWETVVNAGASLVGAGDDGLGVDADFDNDTTGYDSRNDNNLDVDSITNLDLDNIANVLNDLDFDADTGDNDQNMNTNAGDQDSGDAGLTTLIGNYANNDAGFAGAAAGDVDVNVDATNQDTGAESNNDNIIDVDYDYTLTLDNRATLNNDLTDISVDTGGNEQNKNTNAGDQTTGDGEVIVDIVNSANNGGSSAAAAGSEVDVDADLGNDTTGADSDNDNKLVVDVDTNVVIDNIARIDNDIDADVDTGDNEQNKNTNAGSQETGDVTIDLVITNDANNS